MNSGLNISIEYGSGDTANGTNFQDTLIIDSIIVLNQQLNQVTQFSSAADFTSVYFKNFTKK